MTPYEFGISFDKLCALRGSAPTDGLRNVWFEACENLPERPFRRACNEWVESNTKFPSIREIKGMAHGFMSPEDRGEAAEVQVSPAEERLARAMMPKLVEWMSKKISRMEFLAILRWEAQKAGVTVPWDEFEKPVPWETTDWGQS